MKKHYLPKHNKEVVKNDDLVKFCVTNENLNTLIYVDVINFKSLIVTEISFFHHIVLVQNY